MVFGLIGGALLGGGKKKETTVTATNTFDKINKTITNVSSKNTSNLSSTMNLDNKLDITVDGAKNCDLDINQTIDAKQISVVSVSANLTNDLISDLTSNLMQTANAAAENKTDAFSELGDILGSGNESTDVLTEVKTRIEDVVTSTITMENLTEINDKIIAKNDAVINLTNIECTPGFNVIDIAQNINVSQFSHAVSTNLYDGLVDKKIATFLDSASAASASDEATTFSTIGKIFSDAFGFLGDLASGWMIGIVIVIIVVAIFIYFFMNSDGGQATLKAGMSMTPQGIMAAASQGMAAAPPRPGPPGKWVYQRY